ncbi:MAG TPA: RimK/LysX family protein [Candidatus Saccharibacteria bacterium]|nr:RimK/LysX family protein [Candidatus Saccharibacteria bacterium]
MSQDMNVIGRNVLVNIIGYVDDVPAKIDTGADASSIWATNIHINEIGELTFTLFGKASPFYTGKVIKRKTYTAVKVRNSTGHEQIRYRTMVPVEIAERRIRVRFNLSDRSVNNYPILIGRRTLSNKFIVDVTKYEHAAPIKETGKSITNELLKNPHEFHRKYHGNQSN